MVIDTIQKKLQNSFDSYKDKIAVEYGKRSLTYEELEAKSNYISNIITDRGILKGTFIGILLEDRIELIITMVGILKAGCAFVPLDPIYPPKRLAMMINTTDLKYIFTNHHGREVLDDVTKADDIKIDTILTDELSYREKEWMQKIPDCTYNPDDCIYVFFTSGSTGIPKAIMGKNMSLLHFINWEISTLKIDDTFKVSQLTTPSFDACLRDIFTPLCSGGTVSIPESRQIIMDASSFTDWIQKSAVQVLHCTPSIFGHIRLEGLTADSFPQLKYVLMAGERININNVSKWYDIFGERIQLVNLYGPSETTMVKMFYLIKPTDVITKNIPIGVPMIGARAIILDSDMNVCNRGDIGEIYLRTPYMSLGYYNNPDLTRQNFIANPFSNDPKDLIYKTGDLGRILPDGNMEILGRIDRQIKIRGVRIELSEVENELSRHPGIEASVVHSFKNEESIDQYIAAYYVSEKEIAYADLKKFLSQSLPEYMVPTYFIKLDKIPVTINGKLDYKALPHPNTILRQDFVAPENNIQEKLADIWCKILEVNEVGIYDNFMQIGGNSLNIMTMISMIYEEFGIELPLGVIFENPTIKKMEEYIHGLKDAEQINIDLHLLKIPQEYFSESRRNNESLILSYNLDATLMDKIKMVSCHEKVTIDNVLMAAYVYLLSELSEQSTIPLHAAVNENNSLILSDISLESIESISGLIGLVGRSINENSCFDLQDVLKTDIVKERHSIIPFFGRKEYIPVMSGEMSELYDIALIFSEENGEAYIQCQHNTRLEKEKVEAVFNGYLEVLELLTNKYSD